MTGARSKLTTNIQKTEKEKKKRKDNQKNEVSTKND